MHKQIIMKILKRTNSFITISLFIIIANFSVSCHLKVLELETETYTVKELLKSANCDTECGFEADCEGKEVHVKGVIDDHNINEEQKQFFLQDQSNDKYFIEVIVDEDISEAVFNKLNGNGGELFKVSAIISGYDAPTNTNCERHFTLKLTEFENLIKL